MFHKKTSRIKSELMRVFIMAVLVFSILCAFIYSSVQKIIITNENEYLIVSEQRLQNRLNYMFDRLESIAITISGDEKIKELLVADISGKSLLVDYMESVLTQFKILESDIADIALVSDDMHYSCLYHDEELDEICEGFKENYFQWSEIRSSSFVSIRNKEPMFVYGNNIVDNGKKIGALVISVGSSYFMDDLDNMPFGYALADGDRCYILNPEEEDSIVWDEQEVLQEEKELSKTGKYYIQSNYIEKMGCYLMSANSPDINYINSNMTQLQFLIWSSILVVIIFLLLLFVMINNKLVKPLQIFYNRIKEIRSQKQRHLKQDMELTGCLEIQEIGTEFTKMMQGIENLNKTIFENTTHLYEVEIQRQKAELSYLRGQIDPHFLYNTLEVMRKQALAKEVPELAQMAVDMGKIFRYSSKGEGFVSLKEELEIIKSYVRIQENRFQGRLKVFYIVPEEFMELKVMKMLLQPLVENAIYHGIEPKTSKGAIFIGARQEENVLILTVKDNGVGISPQKLEEIKNSLEAERYDTSKHVGVLNTHARIRLTYGKQYGLEIESSQSDGTSIFIKVPVRKESEEQDVPGINCR